jgi:hypothetical protein
MQTFQHKTNVYVSIRQHTSAYIHICLYTCRYESGDICSSRTKKEENAVLMLHNIEYVLIMSQQSGVSSWKSRRQRCRPRFEAPSSLPHSVTPPPSNPPRPPSLALALPVSRSLALSVALFRFLSIYLSFSRPPPPPPLSFSRTHSRTHTSHAHTHKNTHTLLPARKHAIRASKLGQRRIDESK